MPKILLLTADSLLGVAMRFECLADGHACLADRELNGVDAAVIDLDGISTEQLTIAQKLAGDGVPTIFIKEDPAASPDFLIGPCVPKPVEATRLIYMIKKMLDREAAKSGDPVFLATGSHRDAQQSPEGGA
jgi:hypothetical protein